jgi:hypothetical protein
VKTQIFRAEGLAGWLLRRAADLFALTTDQGAQTSLYLASSPEVEGVSGKYFDKKKPVPPSLLAQDDGTARRLWEVSEELTKTRSNAPS